MAKNKSNRDKEKPSGHSESAKTTTAMSTPAKAAHTNPKATPQVPKGTVPSPQPTTSSKLPTSLPTTKPPTPGASNNGGNFQIPKGGDKRARDPSQSSKTSIQSIIPPPTKQQKTYASAAAKSHANKTHDHQWPDLQLRVYKDMVYHEPISYDNFTEVRERMMDHSLAFLEKHPDKGSYLQITSTYYNKLIHCGVYNFANIHALNWFKRELPKACFQAYRGWTNDEQVTTFVKIFVPQGFEKLPAHDYLKASRLMFRSQNAPDIPWGLINESFHPKKHTRQIIASIPTATLQVIQARGAETSEGSGVWKADGFLAPFKVTVASASDMRNANTANNSDQNMEQGVEEEVQTEDKEAATASPLATLAHSHPPPRNHLHHLWARSSPLVSFRSSSTTHSSPKRLSITQRRPLKTTAKKGRTTTTWTSGSWMKMSAELGRIKSNQW
jgi:hypothetical protein